MGGLLGVESCLASSSFPQEHNSSTNAVQTLNICGSSTMGNRLLVRLSERWLDSTPRTFSQPHQSIEPKPPHCIIGTPPDTDQKTQLCLTYSNSMDAPPLIASRTCDIGMFSGGSTVLNHLKSNGLEAFLVGKDAITIVGSTTLPFSTISMKKLRELYGGQHIFPPDSIRLYTRSSTLSGTSIAFQSLLGLKKSIKSRYHLHTRQFADLVSDRTLINKPWLFYISAQELLNITHNFRIIKVRGDGQSTAYAPFPPVLKDGKYPLTRSLYLVVDEHASKEGLVHKFVRWVQESSQVRPDFEILGMVHNTSHIPVRAIIDGCSDPHTIVRGRRVATLYFPPGKDTLTTYQAEYLRTQLDQSEGPQQKFVIVGYSSREGSTTKNCAIAQRRAQHAQQVMSHWLPNLSSRRLQVEVGGPTQQWGTAEQDNRVVIIVSVHSDT
ncbi:MAG: OmpA family protein [Myxococcales bacterium]|nr:OmpA family protein [Myxococcales bacterium]